jgi:PAS domain S-box-containing protein
MAIVKSKKLFLISFLFSIAILSICLLSIVHRLDVFKREIAAEQVKIQELLKEKINSYTYGLQGAAGVVIANDYKFNPSIFNKYALSRNRFENFKGSLGFGFIRRVRAKELKKYQSARTYKIYPPKKSSEDSLVVEYFESSTDFSKYIGLDLSFEDHRRTAAWMAAKTGAATLTEPISLVTINEDHTGFLFFWPIYKNYSNSNSNVQPQNQSSENLIGWSFTPIVLEQLSSSFKELLNKDMMAVIKPAKTNKPFVVGTGVKKDLFIQNWLESVFNLGGIEWSIQVSVDTSALWHQIILYILLSLFVIFYSFFLVGKISNWLTNNTQLIYEKQTWLNAILQSTAHAVISTDPNGVIRTFSRSAEKMLGYSAKDIVGISNPELIHSRDEVCKRALELSQELGKNIEPGFEVFVAKAKMGLQDTNEWTYYRKNGTSFPVRLSITAILDSKDTIVGYLGVAEDITNTNLMKRELEDERAKSMHLSKMSVLGEMASGIAHEINTPLSVIAGRATLILEKISSNRPFIDIENDANKIISTVERIAKVIKSLRIYSRNGPQDQMVRNNLFELVQSSVELCREKIDFGKSILRTDVSEDIFVDIRSHELMQVIINLINNSVDAIQGQAIRWIEIKSEVQKNHVKIYITDSGPGIPLEIQEKIMNPFFTTKPIGKGTGLGLSVCKGFVEGLGGRFYYDQRSSNTRFVIELPTSEVAQHQQELKLA